MWTYHLYTILSWRQSFTGPNCVLELQYCVAHLWRSHYKIHKLFRHVAAHFALSSHRLIHHRHLKSLLPHCHIDRIKQLLLNRKLHRAPESRGPDTNCPARCLSLLLPLSSKRLVSSCDWSRVSNVGFQVFIKLCVYLLFLFFFFWQIFWVLQANQGEVII